MGCWFSRRSGSRVSIQNPVRHVLWHQVFRETLCPLGQPEKAIGEKPQIEPWLALSNPLCLSALGTDGRRYDSMMNLRKRKTHSVSFHYWGWTARPFPLRFAVAGEVFVLTSLFIERSYRNAVRREWLGKVDPSLQSTQ